MPCCLFYCSVAFQSDPKPFKRVIAFRVSSPFLGEETRKAITRLKGFGSL